MWELTVFYLKASKKSKVLLKLLDVFSGWTKPVIKLESSENRNDKVHCPEHTINFLFKLINVKQLYICVNDSFAFQTELVYSSFHGCITQYDFKSVYSSSIKICSVGRLKNDHSQENQIPLKSFSKLYRSAFIRFFGWIEQ